MDRTKIMILGGLEDSFSLEMKRQASGLAIELHHLTDGDLVRHTRFDFRYSHGKSQIILNHCGSQFDLEEFDAIFYRCNNIPVEKNEYSDVTREYFLSEWRAFLNGFLNHLDVKVINRPSPQLWYKSFLSPMDLCEYQANLSFLLPETLISNDREAVQDFWTSYQSVNYIPQSQPVFYSVSDQGRLDQFRNLIDYMPLHLIESVQGTVYNVYLAGDSIFIINHEGEEVDASQLDDHFLNSCLLLGQRTGHSFAQLHFMEKDEKYYLLGLLSMPELQRCHKAVQDKVVRNLILHIINNRP